MELRIIRIEVVGLDELFARERRQRWRKEEGREKRKRKEEVRKGLEKNLTLRYFDWIRVKKGVGEK